MDLSKVLAALREGGLLGGLILVLVAGFRRWWVWGWHHQNVIDRYEQQVNEMRKERDDWKNLVIGAHVRERRSSDRSAE